MSSDYLDSSTDGEYDAQCDAEQREQLCVNSLGIEVSPEIIDKTLDLLNSALRLGNAGSELALCSLLLSVAELLRKSMFLRSRVFDDQLTRLLAGASSRTRASCRCFPCRSSARSHSSSPSCCACSPAHTHMSFIKLPARLLAMDLHKGTGKRLSGSSPRRTRSWRARCCRS